MWTSSVFAIVLAVFSSWSAGPSANPDASRYHRDNELHHRTEVNRCRTAHLDGLERMQSPVCQGYLVNCEAGWDKACAE